MATELSKEQIADLKAKHGNALISVETPDGAAVLVFKKPSKAVWAAYQENLTREKMSRSNAFLTLVMDCVVLPANGLEASAVFAEFPGMPTAIAGELSKLAGLSDELDIKKL